MPKNLILLAQADFHALNIENNAKKALKIIEESQKKGIKLVIFPEMFLVGYPVGNVLERFSQVVDENEKYLKQIAQKTKDEKVIIGFAQKDGKEIYNSIAVLSNGKIEEIIRKSNLLTNEKIYDFDVVQIDDLKCGIANFETSWNDNDFELNSLKIRKIEEFVKQNNPDILINCSASISRTNKEEEKNIFLKTLAKHFKKPIIYVNTTGSNETLPFGGMSRVYDENGEIIACAKAFEEQNFVVDLQGKNEINELPVDIENYKKQENFSFDYEKDLQRTYLSVVQSIRDYFKKTGFERAVLGLSGGLDSTVCAVLLVDALGKENVFGVSMPSKITTSGSKNDALQLAQNLDIGFFEKSIADIFDATSNTFGDIFKNVEKNWDCRYSQSYTNDNIQARARATILWGIANEFEKCLPIATSDKSEAYMGYATINGDMSGGYAPIADITKTKLFALAKWMNKNRAQKNAIPQTIIDKRPGAELAINPKTGKPLMAEEALMPYDFLDEIIFRIENIHQTKDEMKNVEFLYEKENNISQEQKEEWLDKFFRRMSTAHYKWSIAVSAPIVDAHSINSAEYYQPIVSSKIKY